MHFKALFIGGLAGAVAAYFGGLHGLLWLLLGEVTMAIILVD